MIPAGILSQSSRDLSKEIWISWGYDYDQEQGVFVNSLDPTNTGTFLSLKNAKGDSTIFNLVQGDSYDTGINSTTYSTGALDIINRREIHLLYSNAEGFEVDNYLSISTTGGTVSGDVYVLGSRNTMGVTNGMYFSKIGQGSTLIPANVSYPVQTKMDVNDDWYKLEGVITTGGNYIITASTENHFALIRAIVIKLL